MLISNFLILLVIFCNCEVLALNQVNLKKCAAPDLPPNRGSFMPGTYSVFILISLCGNHIEINNVNTSYEHLPRILDRFFDVGRRIIDSVDIYVGKYEPCQREFSAHQKLPAVLTAIARKMRNNTVRMLRLVGVPRRNDQLIQAVSRSVDLIMLQNCNPKTLTHSLTEVSRCRKLGTILVYGPSTFKDIWRAFYGKKELTQIHLEQNSGIQYAYGLNDLMKTLPKLRSIILRCDDACKTNYTRLGHLSGKKLKEMTILSFQTDTRPIDRAGLKISENLGPNLISLSLRGSRPIQCQTFARIVANLLRVQKTENSDFSTMYLNAQDDCKSLDELWRETGRIAWNRGELQDCRHPLPDCKRLGASSVQLQRFRTSKR